LSSLHYSKSPDPVTRKRVKTGQGSRNKKGEDEKREGYTPHFSW